MAKSFIVVKNGAVALPTGYALDSQSQRISERQDTQCVASYGDGNVYGIFLGNNLPMQDISVTGFPFKQVASSNPGFGSMGGTSGATGSTATFTLDTGCTLSGGYIADSLSMDHNLLVAGAKTTIGLKNSTDVTVTWASS